MEQKPIAQGLALICFLNSRGCHIISKISLLFLAANLEIFQVTVQVQKERER